jgi:hypothetical protein
VCAPCQNGCAPSKGYDAFWIQPNAGVTRFQLDLEAPRPVLIGQVDAAPLLVLQHADGESADTYRFDPWAQAFVNAPALDRPPQPGLPLQSLDAGVAVWVSEAEGSAILAGQRSSTRGRFAQDLELISQVSPTNALWPLHLAPGQGGGRSKNTRAQLVPRPLSDGANFALELVGPASVWVTDARYEDFRLEVTLLEGSPPELWLNAGNSTCQWPDSEPTPPMRLWATRRGQQLVLGNEADTLTGTCAISVSGRVEVGLGVTRGTTQLGQLRIRRTRL